jgi:hypothetical protein
MSNTETKGNTMTTYYTVTETILTRSGEIVAQGVYDWLKQEEAEDKLQAVRAMNDGLGMVEGVNYTATLKAS